jgi:hypothetical protein
MSVLTRVSDKTFTREFETKRTVLDLGLSCRNYEEFYLSVDFRRISPRYIPDDRTLFETY